MTPACLAQGPQCHCTRDTGEKRTPEEWVRDQSGAATSHVAPAALAAGKGKDRLALRAFGGSAAWGHLDVGLLASRVIRIYFCYFRHQGHGVLLWQPQKTLIYTFSP
jgi:hypothetical protein